jgi:hypothetical protein
MEGRQYLRSAICATRSKAPAVPRSDTDHTGICAGQPGIDANGKGAEGFRAQGHVLAPRTVWRPRLSAGTCPPVTNHIRWKASQKATGGKRCSGIQDPR